MTRWQLQCQKWLSQPCYKVVTSSEFLNGHWSQPSVCLFHPSIKVHFSQICFISNLHVHVSAMYDYTSKHCSYSKPYQPMDFKFPSFRASCGVLFVSKVCFLNICINAVLIQPWYCFVMTGSANHVYMGNLGCPYLIYRVCRFNLLVAGLGSGWPYTVFTY